MLRRKNESMEMFRGEFFFRARLCFHNIAEGANNNSRQSCSRRQRGNSERLGTS